MCNAALTPVHPEQAGSAGVQAYGPFIYDERWHVNRMAVKERKLGELRKLLARHYPTDEDWALVEKAYAFAYRAHTGQRRESGESFITHPLGVAMILAELGLDLTTIIAGLLHDVVEDTAVTLPELRSWTA